MRNILLLGLPDSLFIRDFCTEVLIEEETKIAILSPHYSEQYGESYRRSGIKEVRWPDLFVQGILKNIGIRILGKYFSSIRNLKKEIGFNNQIDTIFVHYVEPVHIFYFFCFWKKAKKRILVFWGGDILRASDKKLKLFPFFLRQATAIVFMIQNQCDYFQNRLGHKYDEKIHVLDFGNSVLGKIDKISNEYTRKQCKERFGLPTDGIIVHVGYNAFRGQQHLEMMKSIAAWAHLPLSKEWVEKIKFVFHVSYGQEDFEGYQNELKRLMDEASLHYVFIEEYLQGDELAMFRKTCDIFLYGQKTDARSASPLEYIYAGASFICPSWLHENYGLLVKGNIPHFVYSDFADLTNVFNECLLEYEDIVIDDYGRKIIRDTISWESLAPKWRSLYEK